MPSDGRRLPILVTEILPIVHTHAAVLVRARPTRNEAEELAENPPVRTPSSETWRNKNRYKKERAQSSRSRRSNRASAWQLQCLVSFANVAQRQCACRDHRDARHLKSERQLSPMTRGANNRRSLLPTRRIATQPSALRSRRRERGLRLRDLSLQSPDEK